MNLRHPLSCLLAVALAAGASAATAQSKSKAMSACSRAVAAKGYPAKGYTNTDFVKPRSGGATVLGQFAKDGKRYEFNCKLDQSAKVEDLSITPVGDAPAAAATKPAPAPANLEMACLTEGERYWKVKKGNVAAVSSKSTGGGMYEVELVAKGHKGTCTVEKDGTVRMIFDK